MFTVNNKDDTRTTPLTWSILNIVNIDIFNIKQLSYLILVLKLLTLKQQFFAGTNDITKKNSQNKIFFFHLILQLLKFVLRYVYQRMEQEWASQSFDCPLVSTVTLHYQLLKFPRLWLRQHFNVLFINLMSLIIFLFHY